MLEGRTDQGVVEASAHAPRHPACGATRMRRWRTVGHVLCLGAVLSVLYFGAAPSTRAVATQFARIQLPADAAMHPGTPNEGGTSPAMYGTRQVIPTASRWSPSRSAMRVNSTRS